MQTPLKDVKPSSQEAVGMTSEAVHSARDRYGLNTLPERSRTSYWGLVAQQFTNLLVLVLIVAATLAALAGELVDSLAIVAIVLLNGVLGFVQEWRAELALRGLRDLISPTANVIRDGEEQVVDAIDLVPGDLVLLAAGNRVPADVHLTESSALALDESMLTGESVPISKAAADGDQAFAGTIVARGTARGIVSATGLDTEMGRIAQLTSSVSPEPTPLQRQINRLARVLGGVAIVLVIPVGITGALFGWSPLEIMTLCVSLAVAMVPEGLPAVMTVTLALGASAMARKKALARHLQAVETLGAASVICTDKTGTLTENKMTAAVLWTSSAVLKDLDVDTPQNPKSWEIAPVQNAWATSVICNDARLLGGGGPQGYSGSPTEVALLKLAEKAGKLGLSDIPRAAVEPFTSERKRMAVLVGPPYHLHVKGAPEQVIAACTMLDTAQGAIQLGQQEHAKLLDILSELAGRGLRVIALSSREAQGATDLDESGLTLHALVGLIDPPRMEVADAVANAQAAGVRTIMITGDNPVTAKAIAEQIGLPVTQVIVGDEWAKLSDQRISELVKDNILVARARPADKMRLVRALQDQGATVGMTGDGVNDAPALRQADIGVAMGVRGTDIARDSADIVLLDDNYASIIAGIAEGRRQFANISKFVHYLLASNAGEILAIIVNLFLGGPLVFLATQILWMNLVTDGVTAVALGAERAEDSQMKEPPRDPGKAILGVSSFVLIGSFAVYTSAATLWLFYGSLDLGVDEARSIAFTAMIVFEKVSVFAFRSYRSPNLTLGLMSNPWLIAAVLSTLSLQVAALHWEPLQLILHTVPLGIDDWGMILALATPLIIVPESVKILVARGR